MSVQTQSLQGLSQPVGRLGGIKPGQCLERPTTARWEVSAEKQMPPVWLLSVENIEGMPERLVK